MARAGGKLILLGEHAVVYGVPAIAAGLDRGAEASARPAAEPRLVVGDVAASPDDGSDLGRAFGAVIAELRAPAAEVELRVEIPAGCGLGASAAMAVAVARALQPDATRDAILAAAHAWESVFHGNPSGVDTAAAAFGGCIWFVRGQPPVALKVGAPLPFAIGIAGPPASTKEMVESVARLRQRRPQVFEKSLEGIRSLVQNAKLCIEAGDVVGLGKLLDLNQMLLSGLHVSNEGIERACQIARESGALGAKLTGAGGGGCVIALADDPQSVLAAWRNHGVDGFAAVVTESRT